MNRTPSHSAVVTNGSGALARPPAREQAKRVRIAGAVAQTVLVVEVIAGFATDSLSLLAAAAHTAMTLVRLVLARFGIRFSMHEPPSSKALDVGRVVKLEALHDARMETRR